MTHSEWRRLGGFGAGVVLLHVLGFGLFLYYLPRNPALTGLATLAYTFGLRHAFDADHIAAIDNTTRKLLQDGKRPLGTGFFFSLGHSTIVFSLTAGLAVAASTVHSQIPAFQAYGSTIGASVSGMFLLLIGALNLLVLLGIVCIFETPLVVLALVNLGVLSSATLRRNRRKGYFIVSVVALALPGPDPVTTLLELVPMLALFEGSIWLAAFAERRAARMPLAGAEA